MRKQVFVIVLLVLVAAEVAVYFYVFAAGRDAEESGVPSTGTQNMEIADALLPKVDKSVAEIPSPPQVLLDVPYINEAPDGDWTGPWKNACEEATIVMVERFYKGEREVTIADARRSLMHLFNFQNARFGSNANSDAARTAEIVNALSLFKARVVTDPTLEELKAELAAGRPVISLHKGFDLGNKNIPFLATGSSYHTLVLIGYDDTTQQFITHDDGDSKAGEGRRYKYNTVLDSLHDYNYKTNLVDGPPRVLFTTPF